MRTILAVATLLALTLPGTMAADGARIVAPPGAADVNVDGNVLALRVPAPEVDVVGSTLTKTRASAMLGTGLGLAVGGSTVWFRDVAPNAGYGPDMPVA